MNSLNETSFYEKPERAEHFFFTNHAGDSKNKVGLTCFILHLQILTINFILKYGMPDLSLSLFLTDCCCYGLLHCRRSVCACHG